MQEEELKIEAGPDVITIRGKGLIRIVDALDDGALETVREGFGIREASSENTIVVASLLVEKNGTISSGDRCGGRLTSG